MNNTLLVVSVDYTWLSSTQIQLVSSITLGDVLDIRRSSARAERLVDFQNSAKITEATLDLDGNQGFFVSQEALDAVEDSMLLDTDAKFDARGLVVKDVGTPTSAQDATNKDYVDSTVLGGVPGTPLAIGSGGTSGATPLEARTALDVYSTAQVYTQAQVAALIAAVPVLPSGTQIDFMGTATPTGYLACDGSNVSRTTYAALFTAIGVVWGAGDGSTTFTLPDSRRRVTVGKGGSGTGILGNAIGNTGGTEAHTLTAFEMPEHTHPLSVATIGAGSTLSQTSLTAGAVAGNSGSAGSGSAHNIMQPSMVVTKAIKT